ncbi:UNVERIFIED_CONTAM: hypothetical protein PYX00_003566 [Menopon gallinae]|uniref:Tetratricopeptide repeat protein n=1 Tax=Menopon gallinae TaxID=328185 RepID=A0AAW2I1M7_9NEOP
MYDECINLLNEKLREGNSLVEKITLQNSLNVCQCIIIINNCDIRKINDMQSELHKNYETIIALGLPGTIIPLQLELAAFFNFIWWNVYYVHFYNEDIDRRKYLPVIQNGLRRVLGICSKMSNSPDIIEDILIDMQNSTVMGIKDIPTASLMCELFELIILNCLQIDQSLSFTELCSESTGMIINNMENLATGLAAVKDFISPCELCERLFIFGYPNVNNTVSSHSVFIDNLYMIKSVCLFMMKKYEGVLKVMRKNLKCTGRSLWCYLGGLSCLRMEDLSQCSGFLVMSSGLDCDSELKSRFGLLRGCLLSRRGEHKEAFKCFKEVLEVSPQIAAGYYYMGEEYGKIGLDDDMTECFKNLARVKEEERCRKNMKCNRNFESLVLDLLHPADEITEAEANYAVAVAYGLCERFQESAEMFEKYFQVLPFDSKDKLTGGRIIETQNVITALHEHATMSMLSGDMSTSEFTLSKASEMYTRVDYTRRKPTNGVHVSKDVDWLNNLIESELGLTDHNAEGENECLNWFTEEMVYFFEEDMIGLMLSAEAEIRQGTESYKATLAKLMKIFSKHFAQLQKKGKIVDEDEKICSVLAKALAGKVCLEIAKRRAKGKLNPAETSRMFERALSCNQGDKDILYEYCRFLQGEGRIRDAQELWKNFHGKETSVRVDHCQSLALRHLLRNCVTKRELEKIQLELETPSGMDVDFDLLN